MSATSARVNDESWHNYKQSNALIPKDRWDMIDWGRESNDEPAKMNESFVCEGCYELKPVIEKTVKTGQCINCTYY